MRGTTSVPLHYGSGPFLQCAVPPRYRSGPLLQCAVPPRYRSGPPLQCAVPPRYRSGPLLQCAVPPRYRFGTARALHCNARYRALYHNARYRRPVCVLQSFNWVGVSKDQRKATKRNLNIVVPALLQTGAPHLRQGILSVLRAQPFLTNAWAWAWPLTYPKMNCVFGGICSLHFGV